MKLASVDSFSFTVLSQGSSGTHHGDQIKNGVRNLVIKLPQALDSRTVRRVEHSLRHVVIGIMKRNVEKLLQMYRTEETELAIEGLLYDYSLNLNDGGRVYTEHTLIIYELEKQCQL